MNETKYLKLKKPEDNEWADIAVLNENADLVDTAISGKSDKTHVHKSKEIDNLKLEVWNSTPGKYIRIVESELVNKTPAWNYGHYLVQVDGAGYFELELYIDQKVPLLESAPEITLIAWKMPDYIQAFATLQPDPDWQIWDIDVHIKIDKAFIGFYVRDLTLSGECDTLHVRSAYKVQDELSSSKYSKIIKAERYENKLTEKARDNLVEKSITKTATLAAASWTGTAAPYTLVLSLPEATASNNIEVLPSAALTQAQYEAMADAGITGAGQAAGSITLKAWGDKPTINLPVQLIVRGD